MRAAIRFLLLSILVASCGGHSAARTVALPSTTVESTTSTSTTTSTTIDPAVAERQADLLLIKAFWRSASDVWGAGLDAGIRDTVDKTYPGVGTTLAKCQATYANNSKNYREEYVLDVSSVERDDSWVMRSGAAAGKKPGGRVYIMKVTINLTDAAPSAQQGLQEVHVTIVNGKAYGFFECIPS